MAERSQTTPIMPSPLFRKLRKRHEFLHVRRGRRNASASVVLQSNRGRLESQTDVGIGFTATKKIGGAVERNRTKRRLREAVRLVAPTLAVPGYDYVLIGRQSTQSVEFGHLVQDLSSAFKKAHRRDQPQRHAP